MGTKKITDAALMLLLSSSFVISLASYAYEIKGTVIEIVDGDTIKISDGKTRYLVRLAQVDSPEKGQPWGNRAGKALSEKVFGKKEAQVHWQKRDRYGRIVGTIYLGGRNINEEMIAEGHAWVYRQYLIDKHLLDLEGKARASKFGLWGQSADKHIAPWEWRRGHRALFSDQSGVQANVYSCQDYKTCGKMASCEEARFHLTECGRKRLDGDQDGIPCERLCN